MSCYRAQGLLAIGIALAVSACSDPELRTDLRPDGDPEVMTVMVLADQSSDNGGITLEVPTFCKLNDEKVPTIIGLPDQSVYNVCPDPDGDTPQTQVSAVTDALADGWYVRVVFDELLDPNIEELSDAAGGPCTDDSDNCVGSIAAADPFTLNCGGADVAYDGYYAPNGNLVSWPPGPSLVVAPVDFVATGTECTLSLNEGKVKDKEGNPVPSDQLGPWTFTIEPFAIAAVSPEDGDEVADTFKPSITFNAPIDAASVDAGEITLTGPGGDVAVTIAVSDTNRNRLVVSPAAALAPGEYTLTIAGTAEFADIEGGTLTVGDDIVVTFTVAAA